MLVSWVTVVSNAAAGDSGKYDLLIRNGRVIDPETGRDEVAAVAVKDGTIRKIAADRDFSARDAGRIIDARGLVVSPGFINTHTHEAITLDTEANISPVSMIIVQDGITFWLGGNCGMSPTGIRIRLGDGTSMAVGDPDRPLSEFLDEADEIPLYNNYATLSGNLTLRSQMGLQHMEHETDEQIELMKEILAKELAAGSFGVSYGVMYDMGTSRKSMDELSTVSKAAGGMAASHTRYPTFNMKHLSFGIDNVVLKRSIYEAIDTCRVTRVPFIVSHITDMSQTDSSRWAFKTLDNAIREEGLPLAGDIIGHDFLGNDFFILTFKGMIPVWFMLALGNYDIDQFYAGQDVYLDGELYVEKYGQMTLYEAEYLRRNVRRVDGFGEGKTGVSIICRIMPPEDTKLGLQYPWVFIGNDYGGSSIDPETGEPAAGSPRGLGTFSRLLGTWSREEGALSLKQALFKATIAPALWLGLDKKGRLQEGCDADIVIFDPDTIIDRAGWLYNTANLKPEGISHVIVNGEVVVENGELTGAAPGRLVRRTWEIPGDTAELLSLYESRFSSR
jgi:N-acyl-D-amino-acid deacylase